MNRNRETFKKSKFKKIFKREYVPLYISFFVFILLVVALLVVIFHKDDNGFILPDPPTEKELSVEVYDYKENDDTNDLTKEVAQNLKTEYHFITDYYKKGIFLSDVNTEYVDGDFIIHSGKFNDAPFISVVDKSGKLKFLTKIKVNSYDSLKIKKVLKKDKNYYVIADGTTNNLNDNLVIKFNDKGKEVKREILSKGTKNSIADALVTNGNITVVTDWYDGIIIYTLSDDLKSINDPYSFKDNETFSNYSLVKSVIYEDNTLTIVVKYNGPKGEEIYLVDYNIDSKELTYKTFDEVKKVENQHTYSIYNSNNNFIVRTNKNIYIYNKNGELIKKQEYANLIFKNPTIMQDIGEEDVGNIENKANLQKVTIFNDYIFTQAENLTHYIYDLYDKDLNLQKRFVLDIHEYKSADNTLLKVFYIDGKLYEIHLYGFDTPSIMISVIG